MKAQTERKVLLFKAFLKTLEGPDKNEGPDRNKGPDRNRSPAFQGFYKALPWSRQI